MQDKNEREFGLEEIFSILFGIDFTVEPQKILDLIGFIVNKEPTREVLDYYFEAEEHILSLYPEFNDIQIEIKDGIFEWLDEQKKKYGSKLSITKLGKQL